MGDFLLLKNIIKSNKIYTELTGMSVRAFTSLTVSVRTHRNPMYFGANAPLFLPRLWSGCRCDILKAMGSLNC